MEKETPQAPAWLLHLMQSIYDMRIAQKDYYAHKCDHNLRISKHKEAIVDNIIKDGIAKGYIKERPKQLIAQNELFK